MSRKNYLIKEIIESIEENRNNMVKAAFYSDPDVVDIVTRLYERWEKNNRKGVPLDYANEEELEVLAVKARYYRNRPLQPLRVGISDERDLRARRHRRRSFLGDLMRLFFGRLATVQLEE